MKTKARTNSVVTPSASKKWYYDDPGTSQYGQVYGGNTTPSRSFPTNVENITYQEPRYQEYGCCAHSRDAIELAGLSSRYRVVLGDGTHLMRVIDPYYWVNTFYSQIGASIPFLFQGDSWNAWSQEALEACLPTFSQGGESLVNFALELKQLKGLFDLWRRKKNLLYNIASGHLNVSFGWAPFLSDVQRIRTAFQSFLKKVQELQKDSGKPKVRHFRRNLDIGTIALDSVLYTDSHLTLTRKSKWEVKPVYCATVKYIYVLPDMSDPLNTVAGFLDSLGVQLNASIVWNAIPYSFVVDWFFNAGRFINKLKVDNLRIPATVTGFCHSLKWKWVTQYVLKQVGPTSTDPDLFEMEIANRSALRYERRRDIPSWGLDTTVRAPNWGAIALGGSLLVQRFGGKNVKPKRTD